MWVGLIKLAEGLNRKGLISPEDESILPAHCLWTRTTVLPWASILPTYPADFELTRPPQLCEPIFKINFFLSFSLCRYIFCWFYGSISLENPDYLDGLQSRWEYKDPAILTQQERTLMCPAPEFSPKLLLTETIGLVARPLPFPASLPFLLPALIPRVLPNKHTEN